MKNKIVSLLIVGLLLCSGLDAKQCITCLEKPDENKSELSKPKSDRRIKRTVKERPITKKFIALCKAMRKLWEEHITYTRNYIISALADLEDKDTVAERLLKNQDDLGNAIKPYYGNKAGNKLAALLRDHIIIATKVVSAAKENDKEALDKSSKEWYSNADDIATFLADANPNWLYEEVQDMLYKHLEFTTGEVTSRLGKNWQEDIRFYDEGHEHMLMFADVLTRGIVNQFPKKF